MNKKLHIRISKAGNPSKPVCVQANGKTSFVNSPNHNGSDATLLPLIDSTEPVLRRNGLTVYVQPYGDRIRVIVDKKIQPNQSQRAA